MTARKADLTRCAAITPEGPCQRWVAPGESCGYHPPRPVEVQPLPAKLCRCSRPIRWTDEDLEMTRCIKCGRSVDVPPDPAPCRAI